MVNVGHPLGEVNFEKGVFDMVEEPLCEMGLNHRLKGGMEEVKTGLKALEGKFVLGKLGLLIWIE